MNPTVIESMFCIGKQIGTVNRFNMYNEDCIYIDGKTEDGKKFNISLTIETEEKENA